jgi:TPR repeat protein
MDPARLYDQSLDLLEGRKLPKDETRSFEANSRAAAAGYHDAVLAMGWYYLNGVGVPKNVDEARRWYRKSARQREPRAMFSLGRIAYDDRNFEEALEWFQAAKDQGHARSTYWIAKLHWRGLGVPQDRRAAEGLMQEAAKHKDREARRALRFLSWSRGRTRQE